MGSKPGSFESMIFLSFFFHLFVCLLILFLILCINGHFKQYVDASNIHVHPDFIVCILMENSIGLKKVKIHTGGRKGNVC